MVQELGGVYFLAGVLFVFTVLWLVGRKQGRFKPQDTKPLDYGHGWVSDPDLAKENEKP